MKTNYIPEGFHTITPYLITKGTADVMDFLKKVFDAEEMSRMANPDGTIMHAQMRIGDSIIMLSDGRDEYPPMPVMLYLYVEDVDAVYKKAMAAGAQSLREPTNEYYGDRSGGFLDAGGNQWWVATHIEDVSEEEVEQRAEQFKNQSN